MMTETPVPGQTQNGVTINFEYFKTLPGILKLIQAFFGIICMAAASPARLSATNWFLFVAVTCFITTLVWIFVYFLSIRDVLKLPINWTLTELLDTLIKTILYITAFIAQLAAWSPIHHSSPPRDPNLTAGCFGLFNSIAYAAGVYYLYHDWKYLQSNSGP